MLFCFRFNTKNKVINLLFLISLQEVPVQLYNKKAAFTCQGEGALNQLKIWNFHLT